MYPYLLHGYDTNGISEWDIEESGISQCIDGLRSEEDY